MATTYNFPEIEERYRYYYQDAIKRGSRHLPFYEVQSWDKVLNPVELRVFQDIREIGVPLYPVFPVAEKTYLHFANPFLQIGIEIAYKNSPKILIDRKQKLLQAQGWIVYVIPSQYCYHTQDEFFRIKRKDRSLEWNDLSFEMQFQFFRKYHLENCACLLNYIKYHHFDQEYAYNC